MKKMLAVVMMLVTAPLFAGEELAPGAKAPAFTLVNATDGKTVTMRPDDGNLKVVIFTSNQCPHAKAFEPRILEIANNWKSKGIHFYAVDSNDDLRFAEETLEERKKRAEEKTYPFPYLEDGDSAVARAYGARVTPHVYIVDGSGVIRYRGYIDDHADPKQRQTKGLTDALGALTNGRDVGTAETRAFGCAIRFKS
jgi:thiol-disulfide isomerase/thioredoxin